MSIVRFGYNTEIGDGMIAWEAMGTKYNFNIAGKVLGVYRFGDKDILLSEVTSSFGEDCAKGTIDAREITFQSENNSSYIMVSNNNISKECNLMQITLSGADTKRELAEGFPIEQTSSFQKLSRMGIDLEKVDMPLDQEITVCGVEQEKFDLFKQQMKGKSR